MGYAVYEDRDARDYGIDRWAGYGVPGECDHPDCAETVYRGLDAKCEEHEDFIPEEEPDDWEEAMVDGCGLYFCSAHRYDTAGHESIEPKPDSIEWVYWLANEESWQDWRRDNPERLAVLHDRILDASSAELQRARGFYSEESAA